ncbi:hypothetical protein Cgig2_016447 [Carnegiea gigantea]|uniref:Uncharacterized protein n=1 Tax=Carnegiea gigantea TaxID=171969 RepID=A0A9Q1K5E7_9CARY|nr:hypothetical protein Cgig2_016447 [Carnegiea gigantea]
MHGRKQCGRSWFIPWMTCREGYATLFRTLNLTNSDSSFRPYQCHNRNAIGLSALKKYSSKYEFNAYEKPLYPNIASWCELDHGGWYDTFKLIAEVNENETVLSFEEWCRWMRDALHIEKDVHASTRAKLEWCKPGVAELHDKNVHSKAEKDVEEKGRMKITFS